MNYIIDMAFRNTLRNKRRTLLAVVSVIIALLSVVFLKGFMGGFLESMVKNTTRQETGHIRITTMEFREKEKFMPVTENLKDPNKIIEKIMSDPSISKEVEMVAPRINFGVLLSNNGNNKTAFALAGDLSVEKELSNLDVSVLEGGRYLENEKEIILGYRLAEILKYKIGDDVRVMTQGSDYALHLKKFKVVGLFKTHINTMDEDFFQIRLDDAQKLLRMDNFVQQFIIMLKDHKRSEKIALQIKELLKDDEISVNPWSEVSGFYDYIQMAGKMYDWIYFLFALFGTFIIGNIIMMVVMERRHEIGIMKSMGFSKSEILSLFMTEGVIMGFVGSVVGTFLGAFLIYSLNKFNGGIDLTKMMASFKGFPMDNIIILSLNIKTVVSSILLGTIVSAFISLIPSWRAAKMNVVESIKSV